MITREVIWVYTILLHTYVDDSEMGAGGAGGSTQVVVGLGFRQPLDGYFVVERHDRLRPSRREVGLALVGVRGYLTRDLGI